MTTESMFGGKPLDALRLLGAGLPPRLGCGEAAILVAPLSGDTPDPVRALVA